MKKRRNVLVKEFFAEVWKTKNRFLSILLIVLLGVAFFSGIRAASPDMRLSADAFYDDSWLMDIQVSGTLGLTDEDVEELRAIDGVEEVEPAYSADVLCRLKETQAVVKLMSVTGDMNRVTVEAGRIPEKEGEIFMDTAFMDTYGYEIGDTIQVFAGDDGDILDTLTGDTFTIVGYGTSPFYLSLDLGTSTVGSGNVEGIGVLTADNFSLKSYTGIYLLASEAEKEVAYTDGYTDVVDEVKNRIEEIADGRCEVRYAQIQADGERAIADGEAEIADARQELSDAEAELADGEKQIADAKKELEDGEKELADFRQQIADGEKQIADGESELADGERQIASNEKTIQEGKSQLAAGQTQLDAAKKQITDGQSQLDAANAEITRQEQLLQSKAEEYEQGVKAWNDADAQVSQSEQQIAAAEEQLNAQKPQIDAAREMITQQEEQAAELENNMQLLREQIQALEDAGDAADQELLAQLKEQLGTMEEQAAQLQASLTQIREQVAQYDEAVTELAGQKEQIAAAREELTQQKTQLDAAAEQIRTGRQQLENSRQTLTQKQQELDASSARLTASQKTLNEKAAQLTTGEQQLAAAKSELQSGRSELAKSRQELEDGKKKLADGEQEIADGKSELEKKEQELREAQAEFGEKSADAETEIADAEAEIADARKELDDMEMPEWYVLDRGAIQSCVEYGQDSERIEAIGNVFPLIFFLVAALVCLTTMTRMVEEKRTEIGTLKALGYGKWQIAAKYIGYAFFSCCIGGIAGLLIGQKLLPVVIIQAYGILYVNLPEALSPLHLSYSLISLAMAVIITTFATIAACRRELALVPAQLMRPQAPKSGKRILLERIGFIWRRLSFTGKATMRNLFRYKKRFFMTVLGIGGCTGLLLTGFGIKDSIMAIGELQFGEIRVYSGAVSMDEDISDENKETLIKTVENDSDVTEWMLGKESSVDVSFGGEVRSSYLMVPSNIEKLTDYVILQDRKTNEKKELTDDGIIITEKLASLLGVDAGDTVTLTSDDTKAEVLVTAVVENYFYHYVYMTPAVYEQIFGEAPKYSEIYLVNSDGSKEFEKEFQEKYMAMDGVSGVTFTSDVADYINDMLKSMDTVIVIIVIAAGMLAFIVLYNLNNINISERQRELATLKVLGFYEMEVSEYMFRENIWLTVIGSIVGMVFGVILHQFVIKTVEIDIMMFGRSVKPASFAYSILLTFLFSFLVNLAMHFKLKKINMVESLKSVE